MKACLLLFTIITMPSPVLSAHQHVDFGPLAARAQAPLQAIGVSTRLRNAAPWQADHKEVYLAGSFASVWADSSEYSMDYYQNEIMGGFSFRPANNWKLEMSYLYRYAADNKLDNLSIAFHDLFNINQNGREDVAKHRFYIENKITGQRIENFKGEVFNNAVEMYAERLLFSTGKQYLSLGGTLYYNHVNNGPFQAASFEQALQVNYTNSLTQQHHLYVNASITHRDNENFTNIHLKPITTNGGVGYQYRLDKTHSFLLELQSHEGESKSDNELSRRVFEFSFGYRFHFNENNSAIEFTTIENLFNHDNSTDITFTLGYRKKL
ncbi:DUF3187 family protein [Vibrio sp. Of7-15]|uniref:DUF3187 family protein n=1 Tax=Vibrio sp. Of7-15 TaxID=2724879 RepID=UPI001EF2CF8C|nr:DUF3187 family protein [Vibrio sp. Of7-15]MCG7496941.1 DUF3187 family protein [Vibrio sp. Of7-15]